MLDSKSVNDAMRFGALFICAMCVKWHRGRDEGRQDAFGRDVCASTVCRSVLKGGSFEDYEGPLKDALSRYCHVCGKVNPEHALETSGMKDGRIGCCVDCLVKLQGMTEEPAPGCSKVIWRSGGLVGEDSFEVCS